jgi:hypothetical protein
MEKRLGNYNENALLVYFKVKSKVLRFHTFGGKYHLYC